MLYLNGNDLRHFNMHESHQKNTCNFALEYLDEAVIWKRLTDNNNSDFNMLYKSVIW